jgi:3-oxoacyl-[acyl-carrier protein] reductase
VDLGIAGKRAAVAAASKGLGLGVARALVEEGAQVAICGRNGDTVEAAAVGLGDRAYPLVADVSSVAGAEGFVHDARAALGGIDILVLNAGGPPPGDFAHTTVDQYLEAFELNCRGSIAMCYAAVPEMRERNWGRVVAITSIAVRQPIPNLILSNTARAGLTGFLRTLAREVAGDGVTVNSLLPGLHATERVAALHGAGGNPAAGIPAGFVGDPADFGRIGAFVCSEHARYLTGAAIQVDGGLYGGLL